MRWPRSSRSFPENPLFYSYVYNQIYPILNHKEEWTVNDASGEMFFNKSENLTSRNTQLERGATYCTFLNFETAVTTVNDR